MKNIKVVGVFPPPYGGATVKCKLVYNTIKQKNRNTTAIDLYEIKRNKTKVFRIIYLCLHAFKSGCTIVYCLDTKRLRVILKLHSLFLKSLNNSTVLAIGGLFHKKVAEDKILLSALKQCKRVLVETVGMKNGLEKIGLTNVHVFPNPKSEVGCCEPTILPTSEPIRLVFFSQISKAKGVDLILKATSLLDEQQVPYILDFYGHIVPDVEPYFNDYIGNHSNINYRGVFDSTLSSVYSKLNEYDVLLFPTLHDAEGVPGILVEAKMGGITVIASDRCYNAELILESEGFLLYDNYAEEMADAIIRLSNDRTLLFETKMESYKSRKRFSLEEYIDLLDEV